MADRKCQACWQNTIDGERTLCKACLLSWQTNVMQLAGLYPDLEAVAAKTASPQPRNVGPHGNQGQAPLPLREQTFLLCRRIRAFALNTFTLAGQPAVLVDSQSTPSLLAELVNLPVDRLAIGPNRVEEAGELIGEAWRQFLKHEPGTFAGYCGVCGRQVYAPPAAKYHQCECGQLLDLGSLRSETLRRACDSDYTGTARELSEWLKGQGLKASKRSIQRWARNGEIQVSAEDREGRRTYQLGSILRRIQAEAS